MPLLRPLSIFLRNFLVKQHPYFSCCASCGEIKTPLERRICTSLTPAFTVSGVLSPNVSCSREGSGPDPELSTVIARAFPFLESLHQTGADQGDNEPSAVREGLEEEALRKLLTGELPEYVLVVRSRHLPERSTIIADWFTPNGIPCLECEAFIPDGEGPAVLPMTGEVWKRFTREWQEPGQGDGAWWFRLAGLAYREGLCLKKPAGRRR